MKKIIFALIVVLLLGFVFSCQKSAPAAPDLPANTATISPTFTDTPENTATPTATVTPTSTATPPDYVFDNFEDGLTTNPLNYWAANTMADSSIIYQGVITPPPGAGTYAFALTATAQVPSGYPYSYVTLSSGPTGSVTPVNLSMYNYMRFGRLFNGVKTGGTVSFSITILDDTNGRQAAYALSTVLTGPYDVFAVNLRTDYYSLTGGTIDQLLSNIKQINFQVSLNGSTGDKLDYNLVLDDIRFTHN